MHTNSSIAKCLGAAALLALCAPWARGYVTGNNRPFAPEADAEGTTAIDKSAPQLLAWATGYRDLRYGGNLATDWQTPERALGPAAGTSSDVVSLGSGGHITLSFAQPFRDGAGPDFAVFENSFDDRFLELAWVEVSSDGAHYVRFPNYSVTAEPVGMYGEVEPTALYGLAGKYRQGFGTPFDLAELAAVNAALQAGGTAFSAAYASAFLAAYPHLDLQAVRYVRLIDIIGDGTALDAEGFVIYDPYPTIGSAGFDLDAVAVMYPQTATGKPQTLRFAPIPNLPLAQARLQLEAAADSGLPVQWHVLEGPGQLAEDGTLQLTGAGRVVIEARQPGDATWAAAPPVLRAFTVAERTQRIFVSPVGEVLVGGQPVALDIQTSSGLPVLIDVMAGPPGARAEAQSGLFYPPTQPGLVRLRFYNAGNAQTAPAEDFELEIPVVEAYTHAPFAGAWTGDSDGDGLADGFEYVTGSDAALPASGRPLQWYLAAQPHGLAPELRGRLTVHSAAGVAISCEQWADGQWLPFVPARRAVHPLSSIQGYVWEIAGPPNTLWRLQFRTPRKAD